MFLSVSVIFALGYVRLVLLHVPEVFHDTIPEQVLAADVGHLYLAYLFSLGAAEFRVPVGSETPSFSDRVGNFAI